jgi:hypothetical protein
MHEIAFRRPKSRNIFWGNMPLDGWTVYSMIIDPNLFGAGYACLWLHKYIAIVCVSTVTTVVCLC